MKKGWSIEKAVETPSRNKDHKKKLVNCDDWGNDCFNCPLPECNDDRPVRAGEIDA